MTILCVVGEHSCIIIAGIFTCFPPTYDVYSVVIVITTGAGGWLGGGLVGYPEATGITSLFQNFGFVLLGI